MTEPDVAMTDYAVALECVLFLVMMPRGRARPGPPQPWFALFFTSMGAASVFGGTVHGFFLDRQSLGLTLVWPMTLLVMGVTALSIWAMGAALLFSRRGVRWVLVAASIQLGLYSIAVLFLTQEFWLGVVDIVPAMVFLLVVLLLTYWRERHKSLLVAAAGLGLLLLAALLQHLRIGIHPAFCNHNTFFLVLEAVALLLFFRGGRRLIIAASVRPGEKWPEVKSGDLSTRNGKSLKALSAE
jgi:hypothetical protein